MAASPSIGCPTHSGSQGSTHRFATAATRFVENATTAASCRGAHRFHMPALGNHSSDSRRPHDSDLFEADEENQRGFGFPLVWLSLVGPLFISEATIEF